jgi:predicted Zn-dependent protease
MFTQSQAADIFSKIRKLSTADEVEVLFYGGHTALTRFANNTIHQNVAERNVVISVRSAFGQRTARATSNKFDTESLKRVVQASESLAKVQHPDPDLLPMPSDPGPSQAPLPSRYFEQTAAVTPELRAEAVKKIVSVADKHQLTTAGIFSSAEVVEGVFNSRGLAGWHTQTSSEISITMLGSDSSGWQKANSPNVSHLDATTLAEIAAHKASESANPREVPAGKYTVILVDDVSHPLQSGSPFDGEGMRRKRVQLVENGVVNQLVYARATAEKMKNSGYKGAVGNIATTGHGFPLPNEMGEAPMNIVFAPPKDPKTLDQMISSIERGILVTRLWYIREVDPYEKILTGMTRDGTFLVEDGKVRYGLLNFRFNESLIHMLSNVEEMGTPVRASGEESFDMVVPAMKVKDFNFTEVTKF